MGHREYHLSDRKALTSRYGAMLRAVDGPAASCEKCGSKTGLLKRGLFIAPAAAGPALIRSRVVALCNTCINTLAKHRQTVARRWVVIGLPIVVVSVSVFVLLQAQPENSFGGAVRGVLAGVALLGSIAVFVSIPAFAMSWDGHREEASWILAKADVAMEGCVCWEFDEKAREEAYAGMSNPDRKPHDPYRADPSRLNWLSRFRKLLFN